MVTPKHIEFRKLILAEYQAGSDEKQARINITAKFGHKFLSASIIHFWYKRFEGHGSSISDDSIISQEIQTLPNSKEKVDVDPIIFTSNYDCFRNGMITLNGRFAIFRQTKQNHRNNIVFCHRFHAERQRKLRNCVTFVFCDLFHGETKSINVLEIEDRQIRWITLVNTEHMLIGLHNLVVFLKIDYESWKISIVSMTDHTFGGLGGIIDQITRRKFVMYNYNTIYTANLIDNRVVFDQPQQFNIGTLRCPTLIGNNLCGFRPFHDRNDAGIPLSKFYKLNLATLENKTYDVPFAPSGRFMPNFNPGYVYCSSGNTLYATFGGTSNHVFAFDSDALTWKDIGIETNNFILEISVNNDGFLTMQSFYNGTPAFYRYALKQPDTLKNIIWFNIRRDAILFGGNDYEKIRSYGVPPLFVRNDK